MNTNLLLFILFMLVISNFSSLSAENKRIEAKLDRILSNLGLNLDNNISKELKDELVLLLDDDEKIKAVKLLREKTGMGLVEAKNFIDELDTDKEDEDEE